jgi:hypothetical protein
MAAAARPDGCDIAGKNVFVQNLTITNFDDTVCVKPLNNGDSLAQCAYVQAVTRTAARPPPQRPVHCMWHAGL